MSDTIKPVAWYRWNATGDATYGWGWFDSYASGGDEPLYTTAALDAAREQGRQAGLEEAMKVCYALHSKEEGLDGYDCAVVIRALKEKPSCAS